MSPIIQLQGFIVGGQAPPAYVAERIDTSVIDSAGSITAPTGMAVGDIMYLAIYERTDALANPGSQSILLADGWTNVHSTADFQVWRKTATSGDLSDTTAFVGNSSRDHVAVWFAIRNASVISESSVTESGGSWAGPTISSASSDGLYIMVIGTDNENTNPLSISPTGPTPEIGKGDAANAGNYLYVYAVPYSSGDTSIQYTVTPPDTGAGRAGFFARLEAS